MKKIICLLFSFIFVCMMVIPTFATYDVALLSAGPVLKVVSSKEDYTSYVISVSNPSSDTITIYKQNGSSITKVTQVQTSGTAKEITISFPELDCITTTDIQIYGTDSIENKSNVLTLTARGPHKKGALTTTKAPECEVQGLAETRCTLCNKVLESKTLPAFSHIWSEPTWKWDKDLKSCSATFTCKNNSSHKNTINNIPTTEVKSTPASCTEAGSATFTATTSFNGKNYTTTKTATINKLSHQAGDWVTTLEPTCLTTGTKVKKCAICNEVLEQKEIPALNHKYKITYAWAQDNLTCFASAICENDASHIETETITAVDEILAEATCLKAGKIVRKASFTNPIFSEQAKTATVTGIHLDKNADKVCDVCRMPLISGDTSTTVPETTTNRNIFDSIFNNETTTTPQEVITDDLGQSLVFDETTTVPDNIDDSNDNSSSSVSKKIIVVVIVIIICSIGAIIASIFLIKVSKEENPKNSKKKNAKTKKITKDEEDNYNYFDEE